VTARPLPLETLTTHGCRKGDDEWMGGCAAWFTPKGWLYYARRSPARPGVKRALRRPTKLGKLVPECSRDDEDDEDDARP